MNVLAGDIGGTKTWLQITRFDGNVFHALYEQRFDSQDYADFDSVMRAFRDAAPRDAVAGLTGACFAVAGPIEDAGEGRRVQATNLPWLLEETALAAELQLERVRLINDFEAIGYGTEILADSDRAVLQQGQPRQHGNRITLGAGTGLGACQSIWTGDRYLVIPSEAGHADFAPTDATQAALLHHLMEQSGHVSVEHVLSGPGLVTIYAFVEASRPGSANRQLRAAMDRGDAAATITEYAVVHNDPLARQALDMFVKIYGAVAGNLALLNLAFGGVYIAGGIAPRLVAELRSRGFMAAFTDKGKMSGLLQAMPVTVVLDSTIGLKGAALVASRL